MKDETLRSPMPCGHPAACIVTSRGGSTRHCGACEREAVAVAAAEHRGAEVMREYALGICQATEAGVAYSMIRDAPLWRVLQEEPPVNKGPSCVCDREHPLHDGAVPTVRPPAIDAAVAAERERCAAVVERGLALPSNRLLADAIRAGPSEEPSP